MFHRREQPTRQVPATARLCRSVLIRWLKMPRRAQARVASLVLERSDPGSRVSIAARFRGAASAEEPQRNTQPAMAADRWASDSAGDVNTSARKQKTPPERGLRRIWWPRTLPQGSRKAFLCLACRDDSPRRCPQECPQSTALRHALDPPPQGQVSPSKVENHRSLTHPQHGGHLLTQEGERLTPARYAPRARPAP